MKATEDCTEDMVKNYFFFFKHIQCVDNDFYISLFSFSLLILSRL